LPDPYLLCF